MASDTSVATPHTNLLDPSVNKKMSLGVTTTPTTTNNTNHQSHDPKLPTTTTQQQSNQHDHSKGRDKDTLNPSINLCVYVLSLNVVILKC